MSRVELFTTVFNISYYWENDRFYREFPPGTSLSSEEILFDLTQWSLSNEYLSSCDLQACKNKGLSVAKAEVRNG